MPISARAIKKISLLKYIFLLDKKYNIQSWKNADVLHVAENPTTGTVLQLICSVKKSAFLEKMNLFHEEYLPIAASPTVILGQILM